MIFDLKTVWNLFKTLFFFTFSIISKILYFRTKSTAIMNEEFFYSIWMRLIADFISLVKIFNSKYIRNFGKKVNFIILKYRYSTRIYRLRKSILQATALKINCFNIEIIVSMFLPCCMILIRTFKGININIFAWITLNVEH